MRGSTQCVCRRCKAKFLKNNSAIRRGAGVFCGSKCQYAWRRENGVYLREKNPNWRGGRLMIAGRPAIYMPDHPRATREGYVYEHVVIAERALGRPLKYFQNGDQANEVPHHYRDRTDNQHLVIMTEKDHRSLHGRMRRASRHFAEGRV